MIKNEYNGWYNFETWSVNLNFEGIFSSMAEEQTWDDVDRLAEAFENIVNELEYDVLSVHSFAKDCVGRFLNQVNWVEIAEHHFVKTEETVDLEN